MQKIPVWQMIKDAANAMEGDTFTNAEIKQYISSHFGMVKETTLNAQIIACCVNHPSRVYYQENNRPRIANGSYDLLYRISRGLLSRFNPDKHGMWEIVIEGNQTFVQRIEGDGMPSKTLEKTNSQRAYRSKRTGLVIARPTHEEVNRYLAKWDTLESYRAQEHALNKLFWSICPANSNLDEVLLKATVLNTFYSTNIYNIFDIARHIVRLDIDERLAHGDTSLVAAISAGHGIKNSKGGKEINFYSFATKYCSHHQPHLFSIYDYYVEEVLVYFMDIDGFASFSRSSLRDYLVFQEILLRFQKFYSLEIFNLKEIDQYLWQLGKEKFPKNY